MREPNLFISWSGKRAQAVAIELKTFIQDIIQSAEPFLSVDIQKGKPWNPTIAAALRGCKLGIVCMTPENRDAPWLLFEAGALAKTVADPQSHVCPYLLDLEPKDISSPLADFQVTKSDKEDTRKLLHTLDTAKEIPLGAERIDRNFNRMWDEFDTKLQTIKAEGSPSPVAHRDNDAVLGELLLRVREIQRNIKPPMVPPSLYQLPLMGNEWELESLKKDIEESVDLVDALKHRVFATEAGTEQGEILRTLSVGIDKRLDILKKRLQKLRDADASAASSF